MGMSISNNKDTLVSVLIGTYNRFEMLSRCLESIFNQSHKNIEVIVVNDASTDKTIDILNFYKSKFPKQFKFISNKINRGISFNSNLAYSLSSGQYIALIGDDDEWFDRNKIEIQLKEFYKNPKIGLVSTFWNDIKQNVILKQHNPVISKYPFLQILKGNGVYCGSTVLISKLAWQSVSGFDEYTKRGTDSDLFRSIIKCGFLTYIIPIVTTNVFIDDHVRMTPVNSSESIVKSIDSQLYTLKKHFWSYLIRPSALIIRTKIIVRLLISFCYFKLKKI
jgi:glycosyltransferase involved in cell wall biosynthesis